MIIFYKKRYHIQKLIKIKSRVQLLKKKYMRIFLFEQLKIKMGSVVYLRTILQQQVPALFESKKSTIFNYYFIKAKLKTKFFIRVRALFKLNGLKLKHVLKTSKWTQRIIKQRYIHFRYKIRSLYQLRKFKIVLKYLARKLLLLSEC